MQTSNFIKICQTNKYVNMQLYKNANFHPGQFHQDLPDEQGVGHSLVGWELLSVGYQTGEDWSQLIAPNVKM